VGDTLGEDMTFAARHPTSYERVAVVSDEDWLPPRAARALRARSGTAPSAAAREWLATAGDRRADGKA
jgi:hypothetical protein